MSEHPVMLRPAYRSDVPALAELEELCFRGDRLSSRSFRRLAASPAAVVLVGEKAARIVGCLVMLFRSGSRIGRIYSLAVHPEGRREGIASRIIAGGEALAADRGVSTVRLEVREDNCGAMEFYRRRGYREFSCYDDFYQDGARALRLEKTIAVRMM